MSTVNKQASAGVRWMTVAKVFMTLIALIKISVLVRFLETDVFGLMALITVIIGFLDLFMDMGITSAILHRQEITKGQYSSLYWLSFLFGCVIYLFLYFLAPFIAEFYSEPALVEPIQLASLGVIISSLGRQFLTVDQKQLRFARIAVIEIIAALVSLLVAIYFSVIGAGVYALVYSMLAQFLLVNITYLIIGLRNSNIGVNCNFLEVWPFLKIGLFQVGGQSINYINKELDVILIGKLFGTEILGGYSLAKQLVNKPVSIINPIINRVATPILALNQKDPDKIKTTFFGFTRLVSTVNFCGYLLLAILAYPAVLVLYGDSYEHIVIIVQVLCLYMFLRSLGNPIGSLVVAMGRTDYGLYWNIYSLLLMPVFIWVGSGFGVRGVACSLVLVMVILTLSRWSLIVRKVINSSFYEYLYSLTPSSKAAKNMLLGKAFIN